MSAEFYQHLHRAVFHALAAADAFVVVDAGKVVRHVDGVVLAGLLALLAADAGHGAGLAGHGAALGIAAADLDLVLEEAAQGDDLLRALLGADAAAGAPGDDN